MQVPPVPIYILYEIMEEKKSRSHEYYNEIKPYNSQLKIQDSFNVVGVELEDQYWLKRKIRPCMLCKKLGLSEHLRAYTNYWWPIRVVYYCDDCVGENPRIVRNRSDIKPINIIRLRR